MPKLTEVAKAAAIVAQNHSILIYGQPKMGKSYLAGTAAKIPEVRKIHYFDGENGSETLQHMGLSEAEMDKVILYKTRDTKDEPFFIETLLKALTAKAGVNICHEHGRVSCALCKSTGKPSDFFKLSDCNHNDLVIIDSGSQVAESAMSAICLGKESMFKPGWDEYGIQGKWLSDILSVVQAATYTNFIVLTHEICVENDEKKDVFFPLMGTKAFSMKCAKYFGTVIYVHKKLNKHAAGSSSTYLGDRVTGSRVNAVIEKSKEMDMRAILIEGGILKESSVSSEAETETPSEEKIETPAKAVPLDLKARLALKRQTP